MAGKNEVFRQEFDAANCTRCGDCFSRCPVVHLPVDEAKREIGDIIDKHESRHVLGQCTSCMACKLYCSTSSCDPHALVTAIWGNRYKEKGLPVSLEWTLPYQLPTVYTKARDKYPRDQQALIASWDHLPTGGGTALYAGCNMILQPYMLKSKLFDGVDIFGSGNLCCGEPLFRMGLRDVEKQIAERLRDIFAKMKCDEIIMPCLAGYYMLTVVYPKIFGISIDAKFKPLLDWLHARVKAGEVPITTPFKNTQATVHDNCWPKIGGNHFFDVARDLIKATGIEIVEMEHTRENALCCGMGGVAANYSVTYGLKCGIKRLKEAKATGADFLVDYCGGCNWFLGTSRLMSVERLPEVYHVLQLLQQATGEMPLDGKNKTVARKIMAATMRYLVPRTLSKKRFWYKDVSGWPPLASSNKKK
nr:(Fe-S)-binding protein [Candidatus Sigynarchaeota archaeon]